jgi:hypothetical protein
MRRSIRFIVAVAFLANAGAAAAQQGSSPDCDRKCMLQVLASYFAALVAHDPHQAPLAPDVKFVENIERKPIGEGLWKTASAGPTTFALPVPDPTTGQIGFLGMLRENGAPILVGLRLALRNGQIVEAEHLIARNLGEQNELNLQTPRPGLVTPPSERMPHDEMIRIAQTYYDAVDDNNGALAPFASDCVRRENGLQTTNNPASAGRQGNAFRALDCEKQLTVGAMSYIDTIDDRRVVAADVESGLVFGLSHFRQSMRTHTFKITGLPGVESREVDLQPYDLPAAHVFKVAGGKIHEIEAMGFFAPYNSKTGWEP